MSFPCPKCQSTEVTWRSKKKCYICEDCDYEFVAEEQTMKQSEKPRIFISYARGDDETFARKLYDDLEKAGFSVWRDRERLHSVQLTFHQQIKDAIRTDIDRLIYISGPAAAISDYVREEWMFALEMDKAVIPVIRLGNFSDLPEEMHLNSLHCDDFSKDKDYPEQLEKLIKNLEKPLPPIGKLYAVPNLPSNFIARKDILQRLKDAIWVDLHAPVIVTGTMGNVGIQGMGGIGKSVLAAALARDREVRRSYPDGVIWVSVKQKPDILGLMRDLAKHLGHPGDLQSIVEAESKLRELLLDKGILLVLDDVWKAADAKYFDILGPRSRLLVTTRDAGIMNTLNGKLYPLNLFTTEEAKQLLADSVNSHIDELPDITGDIITECGHLPLAISLCAGMARKSGNWESILSRLKNAQLEKIRDNHTINVQHESIWRAMQISVEALNADEQKRFTELAAFNPALPVPVEALDTLWKFAGKLDHLDTEELVYEFRDRSLIRLNKETLPSGKEKLTISLHDLLFDYACNALGSPVERSSFLLEAYQSVCNGGWHTGPNDGYFLQNLPNHLVDANRLDECVDTLCDLDFIQAKASAKLTYELIEDYHDVLAILPENRENIEKERNRQARLAKYTQDLIACAEGKITRFELEVPESITPWTEEQKDAEIERIKTNPNRADKLKDFLNFIGREAGNLQNYASEFACFTHQQAWNHAIEGPVGLAAEKLSEENAKKLLRRIPANRPPWNPLPQAMNMLIGHTSDVTAVAITPDGEKAVSASLDETCIIWDLHSGKALNTLKGHTAGIRDVAITPDGKKAISASSDKTCIIWDLDSGKALNTLKGHTKWVNAVTITPDGRKAVSVSSNVCIIWDLASGKVLNKLILGTYHIHAVAITPDGGKVIFATEDFTCIVCDLEARKALNTLKGHTKGVKVVAITPDGKKAVSASEDECMIWDLDTGKALNSLKGHTSMINAVAITPDGKKAVSASHDHTCIIWDLDNGKALTTFKGHTAGVDAIAITPDGEKAVSASHDNIFIIWDLEAGKAKNTLKGHTTRVNAVAITPSGEKAVSASSDETCIIWDLESGKVLNTLKEHTSDVHTVAIIPDGKKAVSVSSDKTCIIWDLDSGKALNTLKGHTKWINALAITPNGRKAVSASHEHTCIIFDLDSGKAMNTFKGHKAGVRDIVITPDGKNAVSASWDRTCIIWDLDGKKALNTLKGHTLWVNAVAITPDGKKAVSASWDKSCIIWDLEIGKALNTLKGHTNRINAVAITPDGEKVVSASSDKTCIFWDLESGEMLARFITDSDILSVSLLSTNIVLGCGTGEVVILNAHKELTNVGTVITTIKQIWDSELKYYHAPSADCPLCCHRFAPAQSVLETIEAITQKYNLQHKQSPCLELPEVAWEEPGLLGTCPKCGENLKFNPFIVG